MPNLLPYPCLARGQGAITLKLKKFGQNQNFLGSVKKIVAKLDFLGQRQGIVWEDLRLRFFFRDHHVFGIKIRNPIQIRSENLFIILFSKDYHDFGIKIEKSETDPRRRPFFSSFWSSPENFE